MNQTDFPDLDTAQADVGKALASLGLGNGVLCQALLAWIDRVDALLAIKELGSGRYVHVNAAMARLLGRPAAELIGLTDADLMESGQWASLRAADQAAAGLARPVLGEHRIERDGQKREFSVLRQMLVRESPGTEATRYLLAIWSELTASRRKDEQLQRALKQIEDLQRPAAEPLSRAEGADGNLRDGETGLYQSAHFEDQLRREVDLSSREHREFALVSITLDPVSEPVRALGPVGRARILEALGRLLRSNTRAMDASCRLGEDRFAVLLSGVGLATAHARMEGLRRQCATQIVVVDGQDLGFSVSMGVASFPHTALNQDELLHASETALAEARRRGGNHVTLASIRFEAG
ncbi:MAG TPA: diguanylate cyclase [Burkholderiaceae bacterium]|nr:diguanylate cyclase [Burkholderiaceae bacterium]